MTVISRNIFESGVSVGDRIAEANKRIQQSIQDGTQGIRDVKLYGMTDEISGRFEDAMDQFVSARVKDKRNSAGINNFHQLVAVLSVFVMIYLGITYASMSVGSLGVFLFAIFRLSPRVSNLNDIFYAAESDLPHLVRTQEFIEDLESQSEMSDGTAVPVPDVERLEFDDVSFSYDSSEQVLRNVPFEAEAGDFVAFVGQSGAGKPTIVSLIGRLYRPDRSTIRINGTSVSEFDLGRWREQVAVV